MMASGKETIFQKEFRQHIICLHCVTAIFKGCSPESPLDSVINWLWHQKPLMLADVGYSFHNCSCWQVLSIVLLFLSFPLSGSLIIAADLNLQIMGTCGHKCSQPVTSRLHKPCEKVNLLCRTVSKCPCAQRVRILTLAPGTARQWPLLSFQACGSWWPPPKTGSFSLPQIENHH